MDNNTVYEVLVQCSDEPIRTPNAIQEFGFLLVTDCTGKLLHVSDNILEFQSALFVNCMGQSVFEYLKIDRSFLENSHSQSFQTFQLQNSDEIFYGYINSFGELYGIEIYKDNSFYNMNLQELNLSNHLAQNTTLKQFCDEVASHIFSITQFDRVMIYQFDQNYNGSVISEAKKESVDSYMGHHFPADDIPAQARALYLENLIRVIPNASYVPIPISPTSKEFLNLTHSTLRSVSPIHCEYLKNMDVKASMSLSLIVDGYLWGLIACHSKEKHSIHPLLRNRLEKEILVINQNLVQKIDQEQIQEMQSLQKKHEELMCYLNNDLTIDKKSILQTLQSLLSADGVVLLHNDNHRTLYGITLSNEEIDKIVELCANKPFFVSSTLKSYLPSISHQVMGIIMLDQRLLFTREEIVQTLLWAGKPQKIKKYEDDIVYFSPRESFKTFKEIEQGKSAPWSKAQLSIAKKVHTLLPQILELFEESK